ncbi:MAG: neutral/alkaline non-lysosomal ceramidase N-terminal domain-containing protein [Clostridia bacterium]|nr:neutral/alkaline non-lysosomal ceramidase N-terminal domain-containing protein [Clostridia bacterium]
MKRLQKVAVSLLLAMVMVLTVVSTAFAANAKSGTVRVGVGKADITGPVTDISTGYNSLGDLMKGLLMRLNARAFIVETNGEPQVYVSAELVHMTESIKPGVLKELKKRGLTQYNEQNTMIAATHAHSSTSNTSWYALYDLINGVPGYDDESYDVICIGIADAIEEATNNLAKGSVTLAYGNTDIDTYNRSLLAARANKNYKSSAKNDTQESWNSVSKEMSLLVFIQDGKGDVGLLSFFPSHGTSNGITNELVSSDHKGYAAYYVEKQKGNGYVAAFAQAETGDVSPNEPNKKDVTKAFKRPADVDKTLDVIENEIVDGQQEADAALRLLKGGKGVTTINLSKTAATNYSVVDFSDIKVDKKYIGDHYIPYDDIDNARTAEPCIGAGIIAGDEEGAPVDNAAEGAVKHTFVKNEDGTYTKQKVDFNVIDLSGLEKLFDPLWPYAMALLKSNQFDEEQMEKVVVLAVGHKGWELTGKPLMEPETPLQIFRIGEVALLACPFELTTEQGRRTKEVVQKTLSKAGVKHVINATYSNAYSQYMVTREEFAEQHYEGSTDLFGPWSGAALTQELDRLAQDMVKGQASKSTAAMRTSAPAALLYTYAAAVPTPIDVNDSGKLVEDVKSSYKKGETVTAVFEAANPRSVSDLRIAGNKDLVPENYTYMKVQKLVNGKWKTVATDTDPYTYTRYHNHVSTYRINVNWLTKKASAGTYRLVYKGIKKDTLLSYHKVTGVSSPFTVA